MSEEKAQRNAAMLSQKMMEMTKLQKMLTHATKVTWMKRFVVTNEKLALKGQHLRCFNCSVPSCSRCTVLAKLAMDAE